MERCVPFLKWPGGKRWLIPFIKDIIGSNNFDNYYEPFLGGGAMFFSFNFKNAILSDANEQLINTYRYVKDEPQRLIEVLKTIPSDKETYYKVRCVDHDNDFEKAVQFLYLNRLAFGGMYRVNQAGKFNVPYGGGRTTEILWSKNLIENSSEKLKNANLNCLDFRTVLAKARKGDLVYCDPPYTVSHNLNGFQRYNEKIFQWEDQVRLREECFKASERGVSIIVSNAAHDSIRSLYYPKEPKIVQRYSGLSRQSKSRKSIDEYVFLFNI